MLAVSVEEVVVAQTEAAKRIAEDRYNDLKEQLDRAKRFGQQAIQDSKAEIQRKLDDAKGVFDEAVESVKYAARKAQTVVQDFADAAVKAGQQLLDEATSLIDEAIEIVNELTDGPSSWASGGGQDNICEWAKRYDFGTGSEFTRKLMLQVETP